MEILLVIPKYNLTDKKDYEYSFPLGLAYISSAVKKAGYNLDCINLNHLDGTIEQNVTSVLDKKKYDVVCSGHMGIGYAVMEKILAAVRNHRSRPKFILGGAIITSAPKLMFNALKPDYAIFSEGEITIVELLKYLEGNSKDIKDIAGIIYRNSEGQVIINVPRESIKNIDSIPFPDLEGLEFSEYLENQTGNVNFNSSFDYPRCYPIACSRGCPFQCTFCYHSIGTNYRTRSLDNVFKELEWAIKKYKINFIKIYDDLFSLDKDRLYDFCRRIKLLFKEIPWKCEWWCQLSVQNVDREMLSTLKDAGCVGISWGFESYSPAVLKSMRKPITPQQIDKAIKLCMELKINITGNFIFGDIAETAETSRETLDYWVKNCKGQVALGVVQAYPGSAIYRHCVEKGIIKDELDYIKNNIAYVNWMNITDAMTDREFSQLRREVLDLTMKHRKYITVSKAVKENKPNYYTIEVKCPFCREKNIYRNFYIQNRWHYCQRMFCKECHMNFYVCNKLYKFGVDHRNELDFFIKKYLLIRDILRKRKL